MDNQNRLLSDALALKLFGQNVNPLPSPVWFFIATEEEIAEWQHADPQLSAILAERIRIRKSVNSYTLEEAEELEGVRHYVPPLEEDYESLRQIPIDRFTLQPVIGSGTSKRTRCVFHDDRNPSCYLYSQNGFYCFACGAGGNAVDWAMQEFGRSFSQAIELLKAYL